MNVTTLAERMAAAFGDACVAVVLYGSAATRPDAERGSDQNVLVIVRTLRTAALRASAASVGEWEKGGNRPPLILTEAEWRSSRDVFAMEHADIAARHRVLHGALPAHPLPAKDDLRRQLEYEALGALIHLRQGILHCAGDRSREVELLAFSKSTVLALLRSLLRVHGESVPDDAAAAVRQAAAKVGFDPMPMLEVLDHARGARAIPSARADEVFDAYHGALKELVAHVDAMLHPDAPAVD